MTRLHLIGDDLAGGEIRGLPAAAASAPSAPDSLSLEPLINALIATWEWDGPSNGGPVYAFKVVVAGGTGSGTFYLGRRERSLIITGLTSPVPYDVAVTALSVAGESAAAEATATPDPDADFDVRVFDFDGNTGPGVELDEVDDQYPGDGTLRLILSNGGTGSIQGPIDEKIIDFAHRRYVDVYREDAMTDVEIRVPVKSFSAFPLVLTRALVRPSVDSQLRSGALGALNGWAECNYCRIEGCIDAAKGLLGRSQYSWFSGSPVPQVDGFPPTDALIPGVTRSTRLSLAESAEIVRSPPSGTLMDVGDRVRFIHPSLNDWRVYECVEAGTLTYTGNTLEVGGGDWPITYWENLEAADATQPFTRGAASFVCVGTTLHVDGLQWTTGGPFELYRSKVTDGINSPFFVQAAQSYYQENPGGPLLPYAPPTGIGARESLLLGGKNRWMSCANNGGGTDPNMAGIFAGGLARNGGGVWVPSDTLGVVLGKTRPRAIFFYDNWLGPLTDGVTYPGRDNHMQTHLGKKQLDRAIYVRDDAAWKVGVAEQFGWDTGDARLDLALSIDPDQALDWQQQDPVIDQAVMNARRAISGGVYGAGPMDGALDARTWIRWAGNRIHGGPNNGEEILPPTVFAGKTGFDADGYWTGAIA